MSGETPKDIAREMSPPVSAFLGPIGELIAQRMLSPPPRPGLLAVLDQYEVLRVLGGGGMGIVLLARNPATGKDLAIKLVKSDLVTNPNAIHRFLKEAGHLKKLRHPNIVPVEEVSDRAEGPYFVMPFFEKGSLATSIRPGQPMNAESILNIAVQLADGLSFAHRSGIIHRDLKPANILLSANGQACIADFGLARTMFNDTFVDVESRQMEGTAPYMSPAVAAGDAEDTRCDIYSFGALLYELLTGRPPYQGGSTKEILDQIIAGPPKPITTLNPGADRALVAVAEGCMARELRDRYADMRDVLKDLQQIKEGKPPVSHRQPRSSRRVPIGIAIVACVAMILTAEGLYWHWQHKSPPARAIPILPVPVAKITNTQTTVPLAPKPAHTQPIPAMTVSVFAGQAGVGGSADGAGIKAQFRSPNELAVDGAGNIYVADTGNNTIRKIAPDGMVSTLAGEAGNHGNANGTANEARFLAPFGVAADATGNIYVADLGNDAIRKITVNGAVTTLAGFAGHPGGADGKGNFARFRNPWSVAVDTSGNIFVADMNNDAIRKVTPAGLVTTIAGLMEKSGSSDGIGTNARFNLPSAVVVDPIGNLYVSDSANQTIRKISADGIVTTVAGSVGYPGNTDGKGHAARFCNPQQLAIDRTGNLFVADAGNGLVRKISPTGLVTTLKVPVQNSSADGDMGDFIHFKSPGGLVLDSVGNIYVAETGGQTILKINVPKQ